MSACGFAGLISCTYKREKFNSLKIFTTKQPNTRREKRKRDNFVKRIPPNQYNCLDIDMQPL
jgi:hypothetical protein